MQRQTLIHAIAATLLMSALSAQAQVPNTINYQGFLTDAATGQPQTASVNVIFKLYDALTAGNLLYTETQSVTPSNGSFNVRIGSVTAFPATLVFDKPYWLEITVGSQILTPRQPLASSATALRAKVAEALPPVPGFGANNSAFGSSALSSHQFGNNNTASGVSALLNSQVGDGNTAIGAGALALSNFASSNTAIGAGALLSNTSGSANTALGDQALYNNTIGSLNIAMGYTAGANLSTGDFNIYIGNQGVSAESNTIRIGDANRSRAFISGIYNTTPANAGPQPVVVDSAGQLGSTTTLQVPGNNNFDLNSTEGDFRIGNGAYRLKIGVPLEGSGAGDIFIKADGGFSRLNFIAAGGTIIYSNNARSTGVSLGAGSGTWASVSDREAKHDIIPLNTSAILAKVAEMPIYAWRYNSEISGAQHVGPMAQDFRAAFGLGDNDKTITSIDADGIALAAIKGLYEKLQEKDQEIARLNEKLEIELAAIKATLGLK